MTTPATHHSVFYRPDALPAAQPTVSKRYQKSKTNLDFTEARDSEWQWHHVQVHISLQTDYTQHPTTQFFAGWMPFLPPNQQHQSTEGKQKHNNLSTY